jgi:esterase/lipase superfamily enzyme
MLEPALVLDCAKTVGETLAELDRYPNLSHAALRLEAGEETRWFAMPAHKLRWLLQDSAAQEVLATALELFEAEPSATCDTWTSGITDDFEGVVLDGDRAVAVAVARVEEKSVESYRLSVPKPPNVAAPNWRVTRDAQGYHVVPVFFATDRAATGTIKPTAFFGSGRGELRFGVAEVSIPAGHDRGELESPAWWKFEFRSDPRKHVTLLSVTCHERADFVSLAGAAVARSPRREAFVFIHGYNVSFESGARRTAQIAHDLRFKGAAILYSWPSTSAALRYIEDETNARWTVSHFTTFLEMAMTELGADAIHVIAHSMGNRVLTECLRTLRAPDGAARLSQIVLAAPDIDADTFEDLAREFSSRGERVTLYASSYDLALKASKLIHGYPRAGDSEPTLVLVDGVDTIDASRVDTNLLGHSYVGDSSSILADIYDLFEGGQPPSERRFHLEPRERTGRRYWLFHS